MSDKQRLDERWRAMRRIVEDLGGDQRCIAYVDGANILMRMIEQSLDMIEDLGRSLDKHIDAVDAGREAPMRGWTLPPELIDKAEQVADHAIDALSAFRNLVPQRPPTQEHLDAS